MKLKIIRHLICGEIILSNKITAAMLSEYRLFHTTDHEEACNYRAAPREDPSINRIWLPFITIMKVHRLQLFFSRSDFVVQLYFTCKTECRFCRMKIYAKLKILARLGKFHLILLKK